MFMRKSRSHGLPFGRVVTIGLLAAIALPGPAATQALEAPRRGEALEQYPAAIEIPKDMREIPDSMRACAGKLKEIYTAIQAYRKDMGDYPKRLADLAPKYVDAQTLTAREAQDYPGAVPGNVSGEFLYQNSANDSPAGLSYREYKQAQRKVWGDIVPMVRAYIPPDKVLNLAFNGELYVSYPIWERQFYPQYVHGMENSGELTREKLVAIVKGAQPAGSAGAVEQPSIATTAEALSYVDDTSEGMRSLAASGHAVRFERPEKGRYIESVQMFAARYGLPQPPDEDFHLYILNEKRQVLADLKYPYGMVERGELKWYAMETPAVEVPEVFYVALAFNPHQTKGIYLGFDKSVKESHSFYGLPDSGYEPMGETYDWMIRPFLSAAPAPGKEIRRLADWKPPQAVEPFKGLIEVKYDNGESEGMQSYGGRGPGVRFSFADGIPSTVSLQDLSLKGLRIYGSRYGSGYDTKKTVMDVYILDPKGGVLWQKAFPFALFIYKPKWVDLVFPEPVPLRKLMNKNEPVTVAFDPHAHQYRGIYFHYNKNPKQTHSLAGSLRGEFAEATDREWMIRAYLEPSK